MTELGKTRSIHELEEEFGLSAHQILDVILRRNRCKIAVRGAVAEAHLLGVIGELRTTGVITAFEDFDRDGYPDVRIDFEGRGFLVECKNVEKEKRAAAVTVDFQRTRNPIGKPWERYYRPSEFDILAACLWNRTGRWEFRYIATADLPRHEKYPDRLSNRVRLPDNQYRTDEFWRANLPEVLDRCHRSGIGKSPRQL